MYMFMRWLKQLHVAKIVEGRNLRTTDKYYIYPQHNTAQRVTTRRSVIQPSFSLLSSLLSSPLSHTLLSSVSRQKKAKINSARKIISAHVWHFPGIRGSFAGCRSFLPEFQVEIKKRRSVIILAGMVPRTRTAHLRFPRRPCHRAHRCSQDTLFGSPVWRAKTQPPEKMACRGSHKPFGVSDRFKVSGFYNLLLTLLSWIALFNNFIGYLWWL